MRTTVELPDELLTQAKNRATFAGMSLRMFFIQAVEEKLQPEKKPVRRPPPQVGGLTGPAIAALTAEQIDEAMFG